MIKHFKRCKNPKIFARWRVLNNMVNTIKVEQKVLSNLNIRNDELEDAIHNIEMVMKRIETDFMK